MTTWTRKYSVETMESFVRYPGVTGSNPVEGTFLGVNMCLVGGQLCALLGLLVLFGLICNIEHGSSSGASHLCPASLMT